MSALGDLTGGLTQAAPYLLSGYSQGQLGGEQVRQSREQQQLDRLYKTLQLALQQQEIEGRQSAETLRDKRERELAEKRAQQEELGRLFQFFSNREALSELPPEQIQSALLRQRQLAPDAPLPFGRYEPGSPAVTPPGAEGLAGAPAHLREIAGFQPAQPGRIVDLPEFGPTLKQRGELANQKLTEEKTKGAVRENRIGDETLLDTIKKAEAEAELATNRAALVAKEPGFREREIGVQEGLAQSLIGDRTANRSLKEREFQAKQRQWQAEFEQRKREFGDREARQWFEAQTDRVSAQLGLDDQAEYRRLRNEALGLSIDQKRGQLAAPPKLTEAQRALMGQIIRRNYPSDPLQEAMAGALPERREADRQALIQMGFPPETVDAMLPTGEGRGAEGQGSRGEGGAGSQRPSGAQLRPSPPPLRSSAPPPSLSGYDPALVKSARALILKGDRAIQAEAAKLEEADRRSFLRLINLLKEERRTSARAPRSQPTAPRAATPNRR